MAKIRKIVIPVAGYGTRFLPFTKAAPKEMLPLVDKPVIQYIVEQAVGSGIEEVILVTGSNKRSIEDHFDYNFELEYKLKAAGKEDEYEEMRAIARLARFVYVRQKEPLGNGHAILQAKVLVNGEPFAAVWGDDFFIAKVPSVKQLIDTYNKYQDPVITLIRPPGGIKGGVFKEYCQRYGGVEGTEVEPGVYQIKRIIEKPDPDKTKTDLFSVGGYILTPKVMEILENTKPGKGGEIWLVDAIDQAIKEGVVYGKVIEGAFYDCGNKIGFLKATIDLALERPDVGPELREYLKGFKL